VDAIVTTANTAFDARATRAGVCAGVCYFRFFGFYCRPILGDVAA